VGRGFIKFAGARAFAWILLTVRRVLHVFVLISISLAEGSRGVTHCGIGDSKGVPAEDLIRNPLC
jgi:hypothetical protein